MSPHFAEFWKIKRSDQPAFLLPDGSFVSYARLAEEVDAFATILSSVPGPIGLHCDGSYRQYVAYLGALVAGCPVLLMGADQTPSQTGLSLRHLYAPAANILSPIEGGATNWHPDLAVLLSTSGSTGSAKWVRLSFANIAANANSIARYLALTEEDRGPMALPFQYSYGMSVVNSHLAVGAALVLTEGSVVEPGFWATFEQTGCTSLAGVPHSFELMKQAKIRTDHLRSLRYMTQAGGRLGPTEVRAWTERGRDEGWDFFVMYGQTEAAPRISYLPPTLALDTPSAIGVPVPGGELWVSDEHGKSVRDGEHGELCYRGPNTMMGYAQADADLTEGQGSDILKTGDVARRLPSGVFEIVGRKSRFVKLFGLRISLDEVENYLHEDGIEAACVARDELMHVFVASISENECADLRARLGGWLGVPAGSFRVIPVDALPRQASGKVDLRAISALVEDLEVQKQVRPGSSRLRGLLDRFLFQRRSGSVIDVFRAHFPPESVSPNISFADLGGDSLSYVAVSMELEGVLGHLPEDWADMTIAALQAQASSEPWLVSIDTPTLVRALSIMLIAAGHLNVLSYGGGGAQALLVVAGMSFAMFSLPQVLQTGSMVPIATLAIRIALLASAFTLLNFAATGYGEWPAFLFIGNWISPKVEGSAWFVEVYLQLLCAIMLAFFFLRARSIPVTAIFQIAALGAALFVVVAALSDALIDTHHLYRRLPHLYAWFFLIGVAAAASKSETEKGTVMAILLLGTWQFRGFGAIELNYFLLASFALIWVSSIHMPRILTGGLRMVAGASLIIYLSHFQFAALSKRMIGDYPALSWLVAIVGGVLVWRLYHPIDIWLSRRIRRILAVNRKVFSILRRA